MRRIQLSEMAPHIHSFRAGENKVDKLSKWLISWIVMSLQSKKIKPNDLLPPKGELACHIGVSLGTMQNVFRLLEDAGYIESKQKIGSYIKKRGNSEIEKLVSKRDFATEFIKKYINEKGLKAGDKMTSTRKLAEIANLSNTTMRVAFSNLVLQGILEKKNSRFILTGKSVKASDIQTMTLVDKIADNLKHYIKDNLNPGDKIPPNSDLIKMFNVSSKTVHDAVKKLVKAGILFTRRGKYGTVVMGISSESHAEPYNYEKLATKISKIVSDNYNVGDKLPSIKQLATEFKTSEKTVKKALDTLAEDGYITFMRGRYGGTFVTDIPQNSNEAYTWLALNSDYMENQDN